MEPSTLYTYIEHILQFMGHLSNNHKKWTYKYNIWTQHARRVFGQRYATLSFVTSNKNTSNSALMISIRLAQTDLSKVFSRVNSITRMSSCYQCNTEFEIGLKYTANKPPKSAFHWIANFSLRLSCGWHLNSTFIFNSDKSISFQTNKKCKSFLVLVFGLNW